MEEDTRHMSIQWRRIHVQCGLVDVETVDSAGRCMSYERRRIHVQCGLVDVETVYSAGRCMSYERRRIQCGLVDSRSPQT